jgi:hypothetical protein
MIDAVRFTVLYVVMYADYFAVLQYLMLSCTLLSVYVCSTHLCYTAPVLTSFMAILHDAHLYQAFRLLQYVFDSRKQMSD